MPLTRIKSQLMSASEIDRTLVRLAHEILEKNSDLDRLAFIGIRRRGWLAKSNLSNSTPCRSVFSISTFTATTSPPSTSNRW
jgi:pyrimidine operon attenuation protein/uracil phosphoribosyltransferase